MAGTAGTEGNGPFRMAQLHANRDDSFVFFLALRNTKLYEKVHCFAEFRSFRETEKIRKYEKSVSSILRN